MGAAILLAFFLAAALALMAMTGDGIRLLVARRRANRPPLRLVVTERVDLTPDLFRVRLARADGRRLPRFQAGRHVAVRAQVDGRVLRRGYSLAAWSPRPRAYELGIRRETRGRMSSHLHAQLTPGAGVEVSPPAGAFVLDLQDARRVVLVAGGIGITPMRAMVHRIGCLPARARPRVVLFQAARLEADLAWADEFRALAEEAPWFRYYPVLSRPAASWSGWRGRLDAKCILAEGGSAAADFYLCAREEMMQVLIGQLRQAGVAPERLHWESFGINAGGGWHHPVEIDGRRIASSEGTPTLLHALEAAGIDVTAECRSGECGNCRLRLEKGEVRWLRQAPAALPAGEILACCCVPVRPLKLSRVRFGTEAETR
ncbi:MAG: 2Fe-2S iron-sulfur cluster binding domain-containing protein [Betaproteobacteria bacterium]|nr:2Fe-2S iron-sulfur cluster binding domain-containing protein [Betaproteobacteria bacterium]